MKYCGIYSISFIGNSGKFYIGSSKDICRRGAEHLNFLTQNKHVNKHLQYAFNKYGKENFVFEIIEKIEFTTQENLLKLEQQYLDVFLKASIDTNYFKNNGYNLSNIANGSSSINGNFRKKKVSVFDLNNNFIEEINGIRETERKYNVSGVHKCCKGQRGKCGNFIFKYSNNLDIKFNKKPEYRKYYPRKNKPNELSIN